MGFALLQSHSADLNVPDGHCGPYLSLHLCMLYRNYLQTFLCHDALTTNNGCSLLRDCGMNPNLEESAVTDKH
jgi:hypothetical protein